MIIKNRVRSKNETYNKVYQLWYNINARCHNEKHPRYCNYGGKGYFVCKRWRDLNNFIEDIDLIDGFDLDMFLKGAITLDKDKKTFGNKEYSIEKCCFISIEENNKYKPNQQKEIIGVSPSGIEYHFTNQSEFARKNNLRQSTIGDCLSGKCKTHRGWKFKYNQ